MASKSIMDVIQEHEIEVTQEGNVYRAFCPFHNDKGKPNLTIYPETNSWYCYACCSGGSPVKFVSEIEGISYRDAARKVDGEEVDLVELREKVDGLEFVDDELDYSKELNILISRMVKNCLKSYPECAPEVFLYLKQLDSELDSSVDYARMQEILKSSEQFLKKFV